LVGSPDIASYLPRRVLELLPSGSDVPALRELPAAVLVTDISGFTPIAERMVREGPQGVERLGALLNGFYSELFGRVDEHGGEVITIVGDGVISVWPALTEHELPHAIERASQCGLRISRELHGHRPDGDMPLSVRTGLGAGALRLMRLGDDERWELVLLGDAVVQACGAERRAVPGTFAVAQAAWPMLAQLAHGRVIDERFVQVLDHRASEPRVAFVPHVPAAALEENPSLRRYLAPPVRTVLDAGGSRWLAELRHVTVAFLHLSTLDDGAVEPHVLQAALSELQATAHRYAGTFDKLVLDDKGLVANFIFGLPPHAHENDAERAVLAALEARERLLTKRLGSSIGVASGRVFWGPIGSQARRQYCLVGSVMSLGARIMQAAQSEVLCCTDTRNAVRSKVLWEDAGRRRLKGFEDEVELNRPRLLRTSHMPLPPTEPASVRTCQGRTRERVQLLEAVERALHKQGGSLLIEGDAGVGKSTLIEALHGLSRDAGVRTLVVAGDPIEQGSPYRAFRDAILSALGLGELEDPVELARELKAQVDVLPGMSGLAPLLGGALDLGMADSPETEQLEGQLRADRTHDVVVSLLSGLAARGLLLVLEDMHWLDPASLRLAALVHRRVPSISLVMTARRVHAANDDHHALRERADTRIDLAPLERDGIAALVVERLHGKRIEPAVLALLFERSGGNPLFAESLALSLSRSGALILREGEVRLAPGVVWDEDRIPTSLDTVIGSRVDALHSPFDLATLKAAAVLGPVFDSELLLQVHPEEPSERALEESLAILREHGLVASTDRAGMLAFDHAITQEVTYARLPLAQRRELHQRAARAYTREAPRAELARSYPRLAHHYERAHAWAEACDALDLAALSASRSGAFREAASFLSRALGIIAREPQLREGAPLREVRWQRMLGEARDALGHKERMAEHARAALELLGLKPPATNLARTASIAASALYEAWSLSALPSVPLARTLDRASAFEATRSAQVMAAHHYYALEPLAMVQNVLLATRAAEQADSAGDRAKCYAGVGLLLGLLGAHAVARRYVERALPVCDEASDPQAFTRARVLTALYRVGTADFAGCADIVAEAQRVAAARNDHWSYCEAQAIFIWSQVYRGLFELVPAEIEKLRERAQRADHAHLTAWALRFEGSEHLSVGRYGQALAAFRAVLPIVSAQGDNPERVLVLGSLSLALLYEGRLEEARTLSDEACSALARSARPTSHIMVHGLCDLLETLQALDQRSTSAALKHKSRDVLNVLAQCRVSFPFAEARFRLYEGRAALLEGRVRRARASFTRGLEAAERAALRHDHAMLALALDGHALSPALRYLARSRMQARPR
jgi:class 3 adenylate cyclase/tetratricopeptide (TPR) repeat protein